MVLTRIGLGVALAGFCLSATAENLTPDLQLNGYMTAGMAWMNNNHGATYPKNTGNGAPYIQTDPTAEYDSVAGLQFKYRLNDQASLVTQLIAAGQDTQQNSYSTKVNWAYIDYRVNDELTLRGGRFAFSTYMYSENLHVGEAYPWARLPVEIYSQLGGLYSLNGLELLYSHSFGNWNLTLQPNLGDEQLNGYAVNNSRQLAATLSNDNLTLHLGTGTADLNLNQPTVVQSLQAATDAQLGDPTASNPATQAVNQMIADGINLHHDRGSFSDAGFIYDDGKWFAAGEMSELRIAGYPIDFNAGYGSVGHYFGKWLPFVLYSHYKNVNNDEAAAGFPPALAGIAAALVAANNAEQTTTSIGARYQLKQNMSLKMQADRVSGFKDTNGLFVAPAEPLKTVYVYSLNLNAAF